MNLIFICGSLEPGKDGVGDYTRNLATQLIKNNISVFVISVNEKNIIEIIEEEQTQTGVSVPVLRLPVQSAWDNRTKYVKKKIEELHPVWISIQFVPYSFDKHGIPLRFLKFLSRLNPERFKWHIMFHELWVGMEIGTPNKFKLYKIGQKKVINKMIQKITPTIIHTHTFLYQQELKGLGFNSSLLRLFGNMPFSNNSPWELDDASINFVLFGNIHHGADIKGFSKWLKELEKIRGKSINFHFIGSNGGELDNWVAVLQSEGVICEIHGRQSAEYISHLLQKVNYGICSTPYYVSQKSGSVAAMLNHNIPVICLAREWKPTLLSKIKSEEISNPAVTRWQKDLNIDKISVPEGAMFSLENITQQFINDLNLK